MHIRDIALSAQNALSANKKHAGLTMLGVIIGVTSVVLMTAVGASMEKVILGQISSIGAKSMIVFPGQQEGPAGTLTTGFDSLTFEDIRAIEKLETVKSIGPGLLVEVPHATYGREESNPRVVGTVPNYFQNRSVTIAQGRLLDESDVRGVRPVVVLGSEIAEDLFKASNPIGKRIKLGTRNFTVVGVLDPIGTQFFQNADEFAFIPLPLAKSITGQKHVNLITMQTTGDFDLSIADVKALLRQRHGIINPDDNQDKDDFIVRTSKQANDILSAVSLGLTAFITVIAGISLIVGGIGIMNIMLVAVTKRTREIGLRKAVGAKYRDILWQFIIESLLLTSIAGVIGLIVGMGLAVVVSAIVHRFLADYLFQLSLPAMGIALVVALLTGLLFGIYPAQKAAKLSPMNALRYE